MEEIILMALSLGFLIGVAFALITIYYFKRLNEGIQHSNSVEHTD